MQDTSTSTIQVIMSIVISNFKTSIETYYMAQLMMVLTDRFILLMTIHPNNKCDDLLDMIERTRANFDLIYSFYLCTHHKSYPFLEM